MGLTSIAADAQTEEQERAGIKGNLFERMIALLDSMENSLQEGLIRPSGREVFLDIYIPEREKLSNCPHSSGEYDYLMV